MKYPLTFYVDKFREPWVGGTAQGPVIRILKKYKNDKGLYQHELMHVKQWFMTLGLHSFLYKFSEKYRLWSEVSAYKVQLKHSRSGLATHFARMIAGRYDIDIDPHEAYKLLIGD